jgi:hypothetical protein
MQPTPAERDPKWCLASCRQRDGDRPEPFSSPSAVRLVERRGGSCTSRTDPSSRAYLLDGLARQLVDDCDYDYDYDYDYDHRIPGLTGAINAVLEANRRRPCVRARAGGGSSADLSG